MDITEKLLARFWAKIEMRGPDDCWPWTASKNEEGYGTFFACGLYMRASHMALLIDGRPRPGRLLALHSCDNPPCVNPNHLYWGTDKQNTEDKRARGRFNNAKGSRAGNAKLNEEKVKDILTNSLTLMECAEKYGVTFSLIGSIRRRRIWKHVTAVQPRKGMRRGEEFKRSKLNDAAVLDIRSSTLTQQALANKYSVSQSLIGQVRRGVIWRHV